MAFASADDTLYLAARELASVQRCVNYLDGLGRQPSPVRLFGRPAPDATAQLVGLDQAGHEVDLVDAGLQEEGREARQLLLA